jgi:hypothetical protein
MGNMVKNTAFTFTLLQWTAIQVNFEHTAGDGVHKISSGLDEVPSFHKLTNALNLHIKEEHAVK